MIASNLRETMYLSFTDKENSLSKHDKIDVI